MYVLCRELGNNVTRGKICICLSVGKAERIELGEATGYLLLSSGRSGEAGGEGYERATSVSEV